MGIATIILFVYIIIMFVVNAYFTRKNKDSKSYFVAGGSLGIVAIAAQVFCALIGGSTTVGTATNGFKFGLSGVFPSWSQALAGFCFLFFGYKLSRVLAKKLGIMSPAEMVRYRLGEKAHAVTVIIMLAGYGLIYAITPKAMGAVLQPIFGGTVAQWAWISAIVVVLITLLGGLQGLAKMNIINIILMYAVMVVLAIKSINMAGGMGTLMASEQIPAAHWDWLGQGVEYTIAALAAGFLCGATSSVFASGSYGASTYKKGFWGILVGCLVVIPFAVFPMLIGVSARHLIPDANAATAMYDLAAMISPVWHGFAAMVVIAACLSSGTSFLLYISTLCTRDIYAKIKPDSTDKQQLLFGKIGTVVLGLLFTWVGLAGGALLSILTDAFVILGASCWPLILAVVWKRFTKTAAFLSSLGGAIVSVAWYILGHPFGISGFWPTMVVCIVVGVIVTLVTSKSGSEDPTYTEYKKLEAEYVQDADYTN